MRETIGCRFDEQNFGLGCDGMGPFHIERRFERPSGIYFRGNSSRRNLLETPIDGGTGGQAELDIKNIQVCLNIWIVVGLDQGNGLALASGRRHNCWKVIKGADICWGETDRRTKVDRCSRFTSMARQSKPVVSARVARCGWWHRQRLSGNGCADTDK